MSGRGCLKYVPRVIQWRRILDPKRSVRRRIPRDKQGGKLDNGLRSERDFHPDNLLFQIQAALGESESMARRGATDNRG